MRHTNSQRPRAALWGYSKRQLASGSPKMPAAGRLLVGAGAAAAEVSGRRILTGSLRIPSATRVCVRHGCLCARASSRRSRASPHRWICDKKEAEQVAKIADAVVDRPGPPKKAQARGKGRSLANESICVGRWRAAESRSLAVDGEPPSEAFSEASRGG